MTGKLPLVPLANLRASALCFLPSDISKSPQFRSNSIQTISFKSNPTSKIFQTNSTNQAQIPISKEQDPKSWEESQQILSNFNFSLEESKKMLQKAFGFVNSPYWSVERETETPNAQKINTILEFLKSLGLNDEDLHKVLKKFPEVLGCDIDREIRTNVALLEKDWGINGKILKNLLLRNPKVLGFNVDCKGDCMAQCTRCWVRF